MEPTRRWQDITPANATRLDLTVATHITAPRNEAGERCPWPWDPQQLVGAPMGMYRCVYCGAMVIAGMAHLDYGPNGLEFTAYHRDPEYRELPPPSDVPGWPSWGEPR